MKLFAEFGAGLVCVGIWTVLALFRGGFWRMRVRLKAGGVRGEAATVVAVIPARDEEATIGRTVRSLRAQSEPIRIVVADDESSDRTGEGARAAGAEVVRVRPLPAGWKGKLWAVSAGVAAAGTEPEYLLLTDADIEYVSPQLIRDLLSQASPSRASGSRTSGSQAGAGFDLVSLMVRLRCESRAEKLLIPAFVFFFFMLYPPEWVRRGWGPAAAAGGCMLIRREMLQKIGGMAAIRGELIDDCALARAVQAAGGRVWLGIADDGEVRSIRSYGTAAEIRAMISRSAFTQLRHSGGLLAVAVLGLAVTYILPAALTFAGDLPGTAAWLLSAVLYAPIVRLYRAPWWTVFCLPGIATFYLIATVESALDYWRGRGGKWKGRIQDAG